MNTKKSLSIFVFIISGLLPSFVVTEALCENWVLFSTFKNGDIFYYDSDNIGRDTANIMKVRTKTEYSKRGLEEDKKIMMGEGISEGEMIRRGYDRLCHTVILWEMQCQDNISCMLSFTDYDRSGKVLISHNIPVNESCDSITPETPETPEIHSIFEMVCNKKTAMK